MKIDKNIQQKLKELKKLNIYFYNGFNKPKLIDLDDFVITNNYLGDITDDLHLEILDYLYIFDNVKEFITEQPLSSNYSIWVEPTLEDFISFNRSVMLDDMDYLEDFTK